MVSYVKTSLLFIVLLVINCFTSSLVIEKETNEGHVLITSSFKNNLIAILIPISENDTLYFYSDTGGKNYLYKRGIKKLNIRKSRKNLWKKSGLGNIFVNNNVPLPFKEEIYYSKNTTQLFDGMLGREWFANKIWTIDYGNKQIFCNQNARISANHSSILPIYFKKDNLNRVINYLPRINVVIDSDTISLLLDTGAQVQLSANAQETLNSEEVIAISFINRTTFDKWKKLHPSWLIIEKADKSYGMNEDMICVPKVEIGNRIIGPVWFVARGDSNFEIMSKYFMDSEIKGAIGGNALTLIGKIIIDYRKEILKIDN